jgi:hypothetical protein
VVVIMLGPARAGTHRAVTQEATVCSATESLANAARVRRAVATSSTWASHQADERGSRR